MKAEDVIVAALAVHSTHWDCESICVAIEDLARRAAAAGAKNKDIPKLYGRWCNQLETRRPEIYRALCHV